MSRYDSPTRCTVSSLLGPEEVSNDHIEDVGVAPTPVQAAAAIIAPRRRNGRPQACEPCRKRKAACDHALPVCSRCKKRRTEKECEYHAAPMTRRSLLNSEKHSDHSPAPAERSPILAREARTTSTDAPWSNPAVPNVVSIAPRLPVTPSATSPSSSAAGSLGNAPAAQRGPLGPGSARLFSDASGFLGPTSFSATFQDGSEGLGSLSAAEDPELGMQKGSAAPTGGSGSLLNESQMQLGMQVLANVPDEATCRRLLRVSNYKDTSMLKLGDLYFTKDLWTIIAGQHGNLEQHRRELVDKITHSTATPLRDIDDPMQWVKSLFGENLRWEVLGLLFAYWANGAMAHAADDPIFEKLPGMHGEPRQVMVQFKRYASACLELCNAVSSRNMLYLYLLLETNIIDSMIGGDSSLAVWRQHAEVIAVALYLGLHNDTEDKVTLCTETRRRIYAKVFHIDKVISVFVGRPPLLSRRFSSTPLPLDIDNDCLFAGGSMLSDELARLDENGWHKDGKLHNCTTLRARTGFSIIRDGILELALGNPVKDLPAQAMELREQSHQLYAQLPSVLVWRTENVFVGTILRHRLFCSLLTRLGYLQNLFLIERLLTRDGHADRQGLIDAAKEMLESTLLTFKHQDRFAGFQGQFEWLIMAFAAPASGTLCTELLKQAKGSEDLAPQFPRSEVVQSLSIFVAFLDWVKPSAPNTDLCYRVREIVSKILDQVLSGAVATPSAQVSSGAEPTWDLGLLSSDFPLSVDFENFDLMDTFNFLG